MSRAELRLGYWFFKRFAAVAAIVFIALGGIFIVVELSQRAAALSLLVAEEGLLGAAALLAIYCLMEVAIEFLRFPDAVLTTAAGICTYGIVKSGEAVSGTGLGVSLQRLLAPVLLFLLASGAATSVFNEYASYAFTERFERVRARVWGRKPSERVVFTLPGKGLLCAADKVLPTGVVKGLTVVDAVGPMRVYRAEKARYAQEGQLSTAEGMHAIYPSGLEASGSFEVRGAPLAALRLSRYGAFWVKVSDLLRLGDGRAAAAAGKVLASGLLVCGLGMLSCGLILYRREAPSLAWAVAVLFTVEGLVRVAVELLVAFWSPGGLASGLVWGLAVPASVFVAGALLFLRAPS